MSPWTSIGVINRGGNVHEVTAGNAALARGRALIGAKTILDEEYSLGNGELLVGQSTQYTPDFRPAGHLNVGAWQGSIHSLYASVPLASSSYIVSLFDYLAPEDGADGLRVSSRVKWDKYPSIVFDVDGVALFQIEPFGKGMLSEALPAWPGTEIGDKTVYTAASVLSVPGQLDDYLLVRGPGYVARVQRLGGPLEQTLEYATSSELAYA